MIQRRRFMVMVLATLALTVVVFSVLPLRSGGSGTKPPYDPWLDTDDNGKIDMGDVVNVLDAFGATGTPLEKAAILYDSGWINITDKCGQDIIVTHNLNSTDLIVDIQGKTTLNDGPHQRYYGLNGYMQGWKKTYGGTGDDVALSAVQTGDGGYALAGFTESFGAGSRDFWLIKTDASGSIGGVESGLAWVDSSANTVTLYRGATDTYWNYVRVQLWKHR